MEIPNELRQAFLEALAESLKERVETRIPVKTGHLRDSAVIEINPETNEATITYTAPYAAQVEFGEGEHSGYISKTLIQDTDIIIDEAGRKMHG